VQAIRVPVMLDNLLQLSRSFMRAAAILGPGNLARPVAAFQRLTGVEWTSLIEQADAAVIFGGDGTVHRHLSELVELEIPVLIVPCGSGNDFARALGIRRLSDAVAAWKEFANGGSMREIDLGVISPLPKPQGLKPANQEEQVGTAKAVPFPSGSAHCEDSPSHVSQNRRDMGHPAIDLGVISTPLQSCHPQPKYFCCVAGVGIDTAIAQRANALPKWIRAHGGYALSAPREFIRFAPFPMRISQNGTRGGEFQPTLLAAAANTPAYGGGMKIAPHAQLDDGKLDICVIEGMSLFKLFCLFPTVFFGRHLGIKQVRYEQTESIRIETECPLDVYADGEHVGQTPVEFSVAPNALKVIVPE
jgi:diacylglycerol kinase (ATP)